VTARLTRPGVATLVVALDTWTVKGTSMFSLVVLAALACSVTAFADSGPLPPAVAACKAEYQQLGPGGFAAKYGAGDAGLRACVQQHGGTKQQPQPTGSQVVGSVAYALCAADYKQLGANGFAAKYGSGDAGKKACLQAALPKARSILDSCKGAGGAGDSGGDAFKRCVTTAIKNALGR